nr:heat-inducible transcriptional repressor HrcA [Romeriopsis navalis]
MQIALNHRQQQVLRATVRHYIATAEPVGSNVLVREYNMSVSSATIRNAMGMLEREGLLYQPHVSAGRVPSDSGYRLYVDHLMQPTLDTQAARTLNERLRVNWSLEAVLHGAAQILSTLSGYITLVTLPIKGQTEVRHIQLMQVDAQQIMLIVVTDSYETQSVLVSLSQPDDENDAELRERELQVLSNFLNEALQGKSLSDIGNLDWSVLGQQFDRYSHSMTTMLQQLAQRATQTNAPTQLMISGVSEVLRQPEFTELTQLQNLLSLLESQQDQLLPLFGEQISDERDRQVNVLIGAENPLEPMQSCSLISSTYSRGHQAVGSIGVLGPTRMAYESTIALVEATADYLSEAIS